MGTYFNNLDVRRVNCRVNSSRMSDSELELASTPTLPIGSHLSFHSYEP